MENFDAVEYIENLGKFTHPSGLDRIKSVLEKFNNPQKSFKCVHIAGTNGKGSLAAYLSAALNLNGETVGTFTSPHIIEFCERIKVCSENISAEDLNLISKQIIKTGIPLNQFEFITAAAFIYFKQKGVTVAVLEAGMGGRLDATNIIDSPALSLLTEIGLDHIKILGDTVEEIAAEKCGIIKNSATVTAPYQNKAALAIIKERSNRLIVPDIKELEVLSLGVFGNRFLYKGEEYSTRMGGDCQIENALIAIEALEFLGVSPESIKSGLLSAFMPARLQVLCENPLTVLDGAHNADGSAALGKIMKSRKSVTAIVGVMQDKDYETVLKNTLPFAKKVICVTPDNSARSLAAEKLLKTAVKYSKNCVLIESPKAALNAAQQEENEIFIFGSLYLAKNLLK